MLANRTTLAEFLEAQRRLGTTDALVRFITTTTLAGMPADVVAQAKRCLVDGFGVILAGSTVQGSKIVRDYVKSVTDRKEATSIGEGPHAERCGDARPRVATQRLSVLIRERLHLASQSSFWSG